MTAGVALGVTAGIATGAAGEPGVMGLKAKGDVVGTGVAVGVAADGVAVGVMTGVGSGVVTLYGGDTGGGDDTAGVANGVAAAVRLGVGGKTKLGEAWGEVGGGGGVELIAAVVVAGVVVGTAVGAGATAGATEGTAAMPAHCAALDGSTMAAATLQHQCTNPVANVSRTATMCNRPAFISKTSAGIMCYSTARCQAHKLIGLSALGHCNSNRNK